MQTIIAPAPARVNRTAREIGDRIAAMLACPDRDGCPSCTDDAPAVADQMLAVLEAERDEFHVPPLPEADYEAWELGFFNGQNAIPLPAPDGYSPAQCAAYDLGFGDGVECANHEEQEAFERMQADAEEAELVECHMRAYLPIDREWDSQ